jgi:glycosyltransferase involved in cell wall biosynthesis
MLTVSVIIPAYNNHAHVRAAVESVLAQAPSSDFSLTDITVVDDGSTDDTAKAVEGMHNTVVIRQKNAGPAAARNAGVKAASGALLAFLDADDLWTQSKLRLQCESIVSQPELTAVSGMVTEFYDEEYRPHNSRPLKVDAPGFLAGTFLIRKEFFLHVGLFDETLQAGEFIDWLSRANYAGIRTRMLTDTVLLRRIHAGSLMARNAENVAEYFPILQKHLARKRRTES